MANFTNAEPKIIDHTSSFLNFWDKARDLPIGEQVKHFDEIVVPAFPEFYNYRMEPWISKEPNLAFSLDGFTAIEADFRNTAITFPEKIKASIPAFKSLFPDFNDDFDICLIHSLRAMAGGLREFGNRTYLVFGLENVVTFHQNDLPLLHHEFFHVYHTQHGAGIDDVDVVYKSLWSEGMASYVSHLLNPEASFGEIFSRENLANEFQANRAWILTNLIADLEKNDQKTYATYFIMGLTWPTGIPEMVGYYVGYLVAKKLHETHTLAQLVDLKDDELLSKIRKTLAEL